MSDQLSKVGLNLAHVLQGLHDVLYSGDWSLPDDTQQQLEGIYEDGKNRIESATTPAEVDKVSELILSEYFAGKQNGVGDHWARDMAKEAHEKIVATLARQLAEKTKLADDVYEMLSAQLTKAFAEKVDQRIRAEQAESQLAAATRRLGEVEGLVGKWREEAPGTQSSYDIHNRYGDALENCADELEAALTKEPTK